MSTESNWSDCYNHGTLKGRLQSLDCIGELD